MTQSDDFPTSGPGFGAGVVNRPNASEGAANKTRRAERKNRGNVRGGLQKVSCWVEKQWSSPIRPISATRTKTVKSEPNRTHEGGDNGTVDGKAKVSNGSTMPDARVEWNGAKRAPMKARNRGERGPRSTTRAYNDLPATRAICASNLSIALSKALRTLAGAAWYRASISSKTPVFGSWSRLTTGSRMLDGWSASW